MEISKSAKKIVTINIISTIYLVILLIVSALLNTVEEGKFDPFSNRSDYLASAGFTNYFWIIIALLAITFTLYQAIEFKKKNEKVIDLIKIINYNYSLGIILLASRIPLVGSRFSILDAIFMIIVTYILNKLYIRLSKQRPLTPENTRRILVFFSILLAWSVFHLCKAMMVFILESGWTAPPEVIANWSSVLILIMAFTAVRMIYKWQDIPYAITIIWVLIGIYVYQSSLTSDIGTARVTSIAKYSMTFLSLYVILPFIGKKTYIHE